MVLPFGKHKGLDVTDAPTAYLQWLVDWPPLRDPLRSAVEQELERRESLRSMPPVKIDAQIADSIIRWSQAAQKVVIPMSAAMTYLMSRINQTADLMRQMVECVFNVASRYRTRPTRKSGSRARDHL
jgi:hypothetical protein